MKHKEILKLTVAVGLAVVATAGPATGTHKDNDFVNRYDRVSTPEMVSWSSRGTVEPGPSGVERCAVSGWGGTPGGASVSDDNRFVAFTSIAPNMHQADINGQVLSDVFVRDRKKGTTELVSVTGRGLAPQMPSLSGGPICVGLAWSTKPAISGNGRYVAFLSRSPLHDGRAYISQPCLLEGGASGFALPHLNVFVRDLKEGTTELISETWNGTPIDGDAGGNSCEAKGVSISRDGRYVAFESDATNLMKGISPPCALGVPHVPPVPVEYCASKLAYSYVYDRNLDEMMLVSKASDGTPADGFSGIPSISDNGRFVSFSSSATNLVSPRLMPCPHISSLFGPPGGPCFQVYRHDLETNETELVSVGRDGGGASHGANVWSLAQTVSSNGRFVYFGSNSTNLVPVSKTESGSDSLGLPCFDTGAGCGGLYVRDMDSRRTERVDVTSTGRQVIGSTYNVTTMPSISDDGRFVVWDMVETRPGPGGQCGAAGAQENHCTFSGNIVFDRKIGQATAWSFARVMQDSLDLDSTEEPWFEGTLTGAGDYIMGIDRYSWVEQDTNAVDDVYLQHIGRPGLGVGTISSAMVDPGVKILDGHSIEKGGFIRLHPSTSTSTELDLPGTQLQSAIVAFRPDLDDLFVRINVDRLPVVTGLPSLIGPPLIYGLSLSTPTGNYELRVAGSVDSASALEPVFGLCARRDDGGCTEVARLRGGFGTTGESVVASIPLEAVGLENGGAISNLRAFSAIGVYGGETGRIGDPLSVLLPTSRPR